MISEDKKNTCFLCGLNMHILMRGKDYRYWTTSKIFNIYECSNCKLQQIFPIEKDNMQYYPIDYYSYFLKNKKNFITKVKSLNIKCAYELTMTIQCKLISFLNILTNYTFYFGLPIRKVVKNKYFLDIGCGDGADVDLMQKYGWNAYGFEIGKKEKNMNIYKDESLEKCDFDELKFDYIKMWHVLEHIQKPYQALKVVHRLLKKNGSLVIAVPNTNSFNSKLFGKYWSGREIPRHVINYNIQNIEKLLINSRFEIVEKEYQSVGYTIGSISNFLSDKFSQKISLYDNIFGKAIFYPFELFLDYVKMGDTIVLEVKKNNNIYNK